MDFEQPIRSVSSDLYAGLTGSQPDAESQALLRQLQQEIAAGDLRESLLTLASHRSDIGKGHRLLEELVDSVVAASLGADSGEELPIDDHARRLFYILRVEDDLASAAASWQLDSQTMTIEDVQLQARVALRRLLADEQAADRLEKAARQLIPRALLELIWHEAARRTIERGGNFFKERWLKPDGLDYFLDLAYGSLKEAPRLNEDDLVFAFAGFPNLVAADSDCELLRSRVGAEAVLPRLFHRAWPQAAETIVSELENDPTLASGSRELIAKGLRRLRGERE